MSPARRTTPLLAVPALLLGCAPVLYLLVRATGQPVETDRAFLDASTWGLLLGSLGIAAGAATLATLLGAVIAWPPARAWRRGAGWVVVALFGAACVSPYAFALGWLGADLGGERAASLLGSPWAAVGVLGTAYTPLAALLLLVALLRRPAGLEHAALLQAGAWRTLRSIVLPGCRPALAFVWVLITTLCAADYAATSLLQVPTYPVEIFLYYSGLFDPVSAARACLPLVAMAVVLSVLWVRLLPAAYALDEEPVPSIRWPSTATVRGVLLGVVAALGLVALGLPLFELLQSAATTRRPIEAVQAGLPAIGHSLGLSGGAVAIAVLFGWPLSIAIARARGAGRIALGVAAALPLAVPSSAYGIAWVEATSRIPAWQPSAYWISAGCLAAQYAGAAGLVLAAARLGLARNAIDAGRLFQRSRVRRELGLVLPVLLPAVGVLAAVVFARQLNAVGILVLTVPPGVEVLALRADNLLHYGRPEEAALLTLLGAALSGGAALALLGACRAASRRFGLSRG